MNKSPEDNTNLSLWHGIAVYGYLALWLHDCIAIWLDGYVAIQLWHGMAVLRERW